ncbi:MAG: nucleoside monophosphate kinase [Candidatus Nealsonbacteria bacterium]|nr:nucleoside monophosphate kinase [Candidatus Nealsonbacteria bacterium]
MIEKPSLIIILGAPGAGKGTQAELLDEKLKSYYLETSKIIEENVMNAKEGDFIEVDSEKYYLLEEKKRWESGLLCSPPLVSFWVKQKIQELAKEGRSILMAGSPRTLPEGKDQIPFLKKLFGAKNIKAVLLEISPQETIQRNSHRRICELMRHPILSTQKEFLKLKNCPLDGSKLVRRKGLDDIETIKVRLKEYKERTLPLVKYFEEEGLAVKRINGEQSVEKVHADILKAIN